MAVASVNAKVLGSEERGKLYLLTSTMAEAGVSAPGSYGPLFDLKPLFPLRVKLAQS